MKTQNQYLAKEAKATIKVVIKMADGNEKTIKDKEYGLPLPPTEEPLATIGVKAGCTINLGDFNSGRVDVSLFYPCQPDKVNEVYESSKQWVDDRLSQEYNELRNSVKD